MVEQHVNKLFKRLAFLGYGDFEIRHIMREATGCDNIDRSCFARVEVIATLEKYIELGSNYLQAYSK